MRVVIKLGNEVIGSIGASGAAKLDDGCAHLTKLWLTRAVPVRPLVDPTN